VVACCLTREFASLKGFWYVARNWPRVLEKRSEIMKRRRVTDEYLASWFSYEPVSKPAPNSPSPKTSVRGAAAQKAVRR
jgi:hypothetical protein